MVLCLLYGGREAPRCEGRHSRREYACADAIGGRGHLNRQGAAMTVAHAFLLGMMVAWTPSLLVLSWMLWQAAISKDELSDLQQH